MRAAKNVRVLEVGEGLSGAFAGLILANQGASVCQWRHSLTRRISEEESAYFDRGRLLLEEPLDLTQLLSLTDVLIVDLHPSKMRALSLPIDHASVTARQPALVVVAITSMGLTGIHSEYVMDEINEWASGGIAFVSRRAVSEDNDEDYTPILPPGRQPEMLGGLAAATGAFSGLIMVSQRDRGVLIDVSRQEVQAAMLHSSIPTFVWNGIIQGGSKSRLSGIGMLLPTRNGQIYLRTVEQHQFQALIQFIGNPDWANEDWMKDPTKRFGMMGAVQALVGEWTAQHETNWIYREGQKRGVPFALLRTLDDVLNSEQEDVRGFWDYVSLGEGKAHSPSIPLLKGESSLPASRAVGFQELRSLWRRS